MLVQAELLPESPGPSRPVSKPASPGAGRSARPSSSPALADQLAAFKEFGEATRVVVTKTTRFDGQPVEAPTFVNEFWTAQQRQANRLHEVSYRACFKPQLPRFFIERLTQPGEVVHDPFMGRGTTPIESALLRRVPSGCDINPLSAVLARPRVHPPTLPQVARRLEEIPLDQPGEEPADLLAFYHPTVLRAISSLRRHFMERAAAGTLDSVDDWIRMVAINRLTGHSPGFFSVYTLPPNQAASVQSQRKINEQRGQTPPPRDVRAILLKKSRSLLSDIDATTRHTLEEAARGARFLTGPSQDTPDIPSGSVGLVVTSPPFLDVVQYDLDNWLRCWFLGIDAKAVRITMARKLEDWQAAMTAVFRELARMLRPGGHVAFEVGEVRSGTIKLEEAVIPCGLEAGLEPLLVLINDQEFTKTANCWGVDNMGKGTNTNRIVVFRRR